MDCSPQLDATDKLLFGNVCPERPWPVRRSRCWYVSVCIGYLYLTVPQTLHTSTVPECVQMDRLETVVAFGTVTGTVKVFSLEQEKRK
jgi:hypothetical protein